VVVDIDLRAGEQFGEGDGRTVAEEIGALGRRSIAVRADLTARADVERVANESLEQFGRIDVLVNNAGGALAPIDRSYASKFTVEDYESIFKLNLRSTIDSCQVFAPYLVASGPGTSIVNVASMAALDPSQRAGRLAHYGTAKAGVIEYTRYLAHELGPSGVRVNCISPGTIKTARIAAQAAAREIGTDDDIKEIPLRRLGTEDDCAGVLEFLVTDLSGYVTGQVISVCGGRVLTAS
jgi:NAD(P)-dependent dehydrogenase (short-subunit alcohol dehydrogenase family)